MRIVILATEASGDFLGSELIKTIRIKQKNVVIKGIGGPLMINSNFKSWVNISKFNAIGIYEVLIRIFKFIKLINFTEKKIREFQPDIIISIDSPSFNYRLLKKLSDLKKKILNFIIMLHLLFGLGNHIELNFLPIFITNYLSYLNLKKNISLNIN